MKVEQVIKTLETVAPPNLAMDWDNVGLLVGDSQNKVSRILLTIDLTAEVLAEAKASQADMVISYHPLIWDPLKRVTASGAGAIVYELIRSGISVYCVHTALDVATGGVNDVLADVLGLVDRQPLGEYVQDPQGPHYKLVTFVPQANLSQVAEALYQAGAGQIGNYSHCGFQAEGTGTFLPLEGANPTLGQQGQREEVAEVKLESVVREDRMGPVLQALRRAHPYETPAFDVFRHYDLEGQLGVGRIGDLAKPAGVTALLTQLKKLTQARSVGIIGPSNQRVSRAAVCAGSCGPLLQKAIDQGCQLYVTGEIKHHLALAAQAAGMTCVCLSHSVSERFILKKLAKQLKKDLTAVTIQLSRKDKDPFVWKDL